MAYLPEVLEPFEKDLAPFFRGQERMLCSQIITRGIVVFFFYLVRVRYSGDVG